jgi:predicted AlkP superfamily pyrophosphatase or phosphodiesterase
MPTFIMHSAIVIEANEFTTYLARLTLEEAMRRIVAAAFFALATAMAAAQDPTVIVLSWDGIRWDYPDRADFPGLDRMASQGVRGKLTPIYPSKTFPTHVSMATGTYPDRHGVMDNAFWDPVRKAMYDVRDADWLDAEPVWIAAERQGVKTATYFWVGSESDWRGQGMSFRETPFDNKRPEAEKVSQYLRWLDLPESERPRLIMGYWSGADSVGHTLGPSDPAIVSQLHAQDRELQKLLRALDERGAWPSTTLIIVSDHGMVDVSKSVDVEAHLATAGIDAKVNGTSVAHVFLRDATERDRARRILEALKDDYPIRVFVRNEIPEDWRLRHPTRAGDLIVSVEAPYQIVPKRQASGLGQLRGSHGFDPADPDMKAVFLALGRGAPATNELVDVHQVDLAATIAGLLGIDPPMQSEGTAMDWLDVTTR